MSDNFKRKCFKCGRSPSIDIETKLYRFPNPGPTNAERRESWAKYCFPNAPWYNEAFQRSLYADHKMLCDKHFAITSFTNYAEKKLNRHAVPYVENEQLSLEDSQMIDAPSSQHSASQCNLREAVAIHNKCTKGPLHRFPNAKKYPERLKAWVDCLGGKLETESDFERYRKKMVCDKHFTDADRVRNQRLSALAIPSLYLKGVVVHVFPDPTKFPERFKLWVNLVGGKLETPSDYMFYRKKRICDIHFEDSHKNRFKCVNALAVPTLHLSGGNESYIETDRSTLKPPNKKRIKEAEELNTLTNTDNTLINAEDTLINAEDTLINAEDTTDTALRSPSPTHSDDVPVVEPELEPEPFSWQNSIPIPIEKDEIFTEDTDQLFYGEEVCSQLNASSKDFPEKKNTASVLNVEQSHTTDTPSKDGEEEKKYVPEKHADFSCDYCMGEIIGFRYTCVQCENYDLCRACEHSLVHPQHYMLRVPRPTKHTEIKAVVAAIRSKLALLEESLRAYNTSWLDDVEIKKEEDPFPFELEEPVLPMETAENSTQQEEENPVPDADPENENNENKHTNLNINSDVQDICNENTDTNFNANINSVSATHFNIINNSNLASLIFNGEPINIITTDSDIINLSNQQGVVLNGELMHIISTDSDIMNINNQPRVVLNRVPINVETTDLDITNITNQPRVVINREPINIKTIDSDIMNISKQPRVVLNRESINMKPTDSGILNINIQPRVVLNREPLNIRTTDTNKISTATVEINKERKKDSKRPKLLALNKKDSEIILFQNQFVEDFKNIETSKKLASKKKRSEARVTTEERTKDSKRMKMSEIYESFAEANLVNINKAKHLLKKETVTDSESRKLFVRDENIIVNPSEVVDNRVETVEEYMGEIWLDDTILQSEEIIDSADSTIDRFS